MSAINKILTLHKTNLIELETLEIDWYINWIWWEWWLKFDELVKSFCINASNFDLDKWNKLFDDIRILANLHDMNYYYKKWFIKSNYYLSRDLYILLNWMNWFKRVWIALLIFTLTMIYWRKYYFTK